MSKGVKWFGYGAAFGLGFVVEIICTDPVTLRAISKRLEGLAELSVNDRETRDRRLAVMIAEEIARKKAK